jgi:hypothetical protein
MYPIPKNNPFPLNAVVTTSIDELQNYQTQSSIEARDKLDIFIEDFVSPEQKPGFALGIKGRVGSGKTHVIFQLIRQLEQRKKLICKTIYGKADKIDILDLYKNHFARKLEPDDLKNLVSLHLAKLLRGRSEEIAPEASEQKNLLQIASEEVDRLIAKNPQDILSLVRKDLLPATGLRQELSAEIEETALGLTSDFLMAYSRITHPRLGPLAIKWIKGDKISETEQKDLGLKTAGILTDVHAKEAFRFVLGAFRKANYAVMFCVDEFERFSSPGQAEDKKALASLLKDLAEAFKDTGQCLIVAGVNDAWNNLPPDVYDRIKRPDIIEIQLEKKEAKGLLNVYCRTFPRATDLFKEESLSLLYEVSGHNTRQLLNLAHYTVADALNSKQVSEAFPIMPEQIEESASKVLSGVTRVNAVVQEIEDVAQELGMVHLRQTGTGGVKHQFTIGDPQRPVAIIMVAESIFKLSELSDARTVVSVSLELRKQFALTRLCVVVVGYSTAEVRKDMANAVDSVFLYEEDSFKADFREFLKAGNLTSEVKQQLLSQREISEDLLRRSDDKYLARREEIEEIAQALKKLQLETARGLDRTRDKRVTDKVTASLDEVGSLLQQEESLAVELLARTRKDKTDNTSLREQSEIASELIDRQLSYLQRTDILNEPLPQSERFARALDYLIELTSKSQYSWASMPQRTDFSWMVNDDLTKVRELITSRTRQLNELETIHIQRMKIGLSRLYLSLAHGLSQMSLAVIILWLLALVGIGLDAYSLSAAWYRDKSIVEGYVTTLSGIQDMASRIELDPAAKATQQGETNMQQLIQLTAGLGSGLSKGRTPEYWQSPSGRDISELEWLVSELGLARAEKDAAATSSVRNVLREIRSKSQSIQESLTPISFGPFAIKFIRVNRVLFTLAFLPLLLLLSRSLIRRILPGTAARLPLVKW